MFVRRAPLIPDGGMTRRQFLRLTGVGAAAIAAAGSPALAHAAGRSSATPIRGGSIRLGDTFDVTTFKPYLVGDNVTIWLLPLVYDTLTRATADGLSVEGSLAESWEISPDGKTYTFRLRRGVTFHDGSPLTADDVKFAIDQVVFAKDSQWNFLFGAYKSMDVVDPYTVRAQLSAPHAAFLADMALFATAIYPKKLFGNQLWSHPIGTGPFKFVSWSKGSEVVLARNPDFWRKNGQPYIDTYHHLSVPDPNTRALQVQSGETDIALYVSPAIARALQGNPSVSVHVSPFLETVFISMNISLSNPPLDNKLVRQALNYAVDKDVIVQKILFGYGRSWGQGLQPLFGADPSIKPYAYDPTRAKALLKQAGFAQGFTCECLVDNSRPTDAQVITLIQQQLSQIGVKVSIRLISPSAMGNILQGNPPYKYQMRVNVSSSDIVDPDEQVNYMMNGEGGQFAIFTTYNNKQVNALLQQAGEEQDRATRQKLYYQADGIFHDDAPFIFLYSDDNVTLTSPKVQGFNPQPIGSFRMDEVWLQP